MNMKEESLYFLRKQIMDMMEDVMLTCLKDIVSVIAVVLPVRAIYAEDVVIDCTN